MCSKIINLEGHLNCIIGSKGTAILVDGGFCLPVELHLERSAPAVCAAGLIYQTLFRQLISLKNTRMYGTQHGPTSNSCGGFGLWPRLFTELATRPIQSISCDAHGCVMDVLSPLSATGTKRIEVFSLQSVSL